VSLEREISPGDLQSVHEGTQTRRLQDAEVGVKTELAIFPNQTPILFDVGTIMGLSYVLGGAAWLQKLQHAGAAR
jgi:hypothetical protein